MEEKNQEWEAAAKSAATAEGKTWSVGQTSAGKPVLKVTQNYVGGKTTTALTPLMWREAEEIIAALSVQVAIHESEEGA